MCADLIVTELDTGIIDFSTLVFHQVLDWEF